MNLPLANRVAVVILDDTLSIESIAFVVLSHCVKHLFGQLVLQYASELCLVLKGRIAHSYMQLEPHLANLSSLRKVLLEMNLYVRA